MSCDNPEDYYGTSIQKLTGEALERANATAVEAMKAFKEIKAGAIDAKDGRYTIEPGPAYRQMQLYHNRNVLTDSVRKTLARLYLETTP